MGIDPINSFFIPFLYIYSFSVMLKNTLKLPCQRVVNICIMKVNYYFINYLLFHYKYLLYFSIL